MTISAIRLPKPLHLDKRQSEIVVRILAGPPMPTSSKPPRRKHGTSQGPVVIGGDYNEGQDRLQAQGL